MRLIRGLHNLPVFPAGSVVTIGAFDGLHCGHQAVLAAVRAKSAELNLPSVVICFEPLPREFFAPLQSPSRIMNFREKFELLRKLGINAVLRIGFEARLQQMSAQAFIEAVFVNGLHARHITIGDDFRFGQNREGGKPLLLSLAATYGYTVAETPSYQLDGCRVSSSRIRACLEAANFAAAEALLGRPYTLAGKVVYGRQLGRELGFPTANVQIKRHRAALSGVYLVRMALADGSRVYGVANVGTRPTVNAGIKAILEVHLLYFQGSLYGQYVTVQFYKKLRDEQKFESLAVLQSAIQHDVDTARVWVDSINGQQAWQTTNTR